MYFLKEITSIIKNVSTSDATFNTQDLWLLVQKSILSGEYYREDAIEEITAIEEILEQLGSNFQVEQAISTEGTTKTNISNLTSEINQFKKQYLTKLKELANSVYENLQFLASGEDGIIVDTSHLRNYKFTKEVAESLHANVSDQEILNVSLFDLNILLAYLDEYLECNSEIHNELSSIEKYLKIEFRNNLNGEIFDIIKQKAAFLKYKIERRNSKNKETNLPKLNNENVYYSFKDKLDEHYSRRQPKAYNLARTCESYDSDQPTLFKLEIFHRVNHYYSRLDDDHNKYRKKGIEKLLKKIKDVRKKEEFLTLFNKIAFKSFETLLYNSSIDFNLRIEEEDNRFYNIIEDFKSYITGEKDELNVQYLDNLEQELNHISDANSQNYYCYELFLEFLDRLLKFFRLNPSKIIELEKEMLDETGLPELRKRIEVIVIYIRALYSNALRHINDNLDRMMTHEIKPVYLTWEECFINHKWQDGIQGELFVDSAYILPNNFKAIKSKIDAWGLFLDSEMNLLTNSFGMELNVKFMENKTQNYEKKVKENEIKVVQIVSIFVSIATFVLINVKIFDNKSGLESFAIILGLAACFVLFNLFFYFLIYAQLPQPKSVRARVYKFSLLLLLPVVLAFGSYYILHNEGEKSSREFKEFKEKMKRDSTEFRIRIDQTK